VNTDALEKLIEVADLWARVHVALVEALVKRGVPEEEARIEARMTAWLIATDDKDAPTPPWEE
jgi:hypothetical protein